MLRSHLSVQLFSTVRNSSDHLEVRGCSDSIPYEVESSCSLRVVPISILFRRTCSGIVRKHFLSIYSCTSNLVVSNDELVHSSLLVQRFVFLFSGANRSLFRRLQTQNLSWCELQDFTAQEAQNLMKIW